MRQTIIFLSLINISLCLTLSSCEKESPPIIVEPEPEWMPDSCDISIPGLYSAWGVSFGKLYPHYLYPCFNPNNENEVIFREDWATVDTIVNDTTYHQIHTGLVKYNLATKEKQLLYEGAVGPRPRWSRKGWILLVLPDTKIYKIKSNGDSLTQLTFEGKCLGPEWNKWGDQFVYNLVENTGNISVFCDEAGNEIFRKQGASISPSWQHDSLLTQVNIYALTVWNPLSDSVEIIQESGISGTFGAEWLDDKSIIWSNNEGIYISDRISKETIQIRETCIGDYFNQPTFNSLSQKVIFNRRNRTITNVEEAYGTTEYSLYMMDTDGTELEKIEVPEW